jgi:hypothetical protein
MTSMCSPFLTRYSRLQLLLPTAQHELTHPAVRPHSTSGRSSTYKGHYCRVELWSLSLPTLLILKQWILGLMWFITSSCPLPDTLLQHNSVPLLLCYLSPGVDFIHTISQVIQGLSLLLLPSHSMVLWSRWQLQTAHDSAPVGRAISGRNLRTIQPKILLTAENSSPAASVGVIPNFFPLFCAFHPRWHALLILLKSTCGMWGYLTQSQNLLIRLKSTCDTRGYLTQSQNLLTLPNLTHGIHGTNWVTFLELIRV